MSKKNKAKGLTVSTLSGLMAIGALGMPVSVLAEGASNAESSEELITSIIDNNGNRKGYKFVYKKQKVDELKRDPSVYGLKLVQGLNKEGKPFNPSEEDVKNASITFASGIGGEQAAEVKYDGLYELVGLQREPGFYPVMSENMHEEGDEGLFEFPRIKERDAEDKIYTHTQEVEMKESQFLEQLEVILQNEHRFGLVGDFSLERIAEPTEVYGKFTEEELEKTFKDEEIHDGYNAPETEDLANTVKTWGALDEVVKIADLRTTLKANKVIGEDLKDNELKFVSELTKGLTEGVYRLEQKTTDKGYTIRPEIIFVITIDSDGETPVIKFIESNEDGKFSEQLDEFKTLQIHENEQFKYGDAGKDTDIYQALLVNFTKPGYIPVDPNTPDPNDPHNPSKHGFKKFVSRKAETNDIDKADAIVEEARGDHIKVNIGEVFAFDFDIYLPGNIAEYERFEFQDFFDDAINVEDVTKESIVIKDAEGNEIPSEVMKEFKKEGQDVRVEFEPEKLEEHANKFINIEINDVYLNKGTVENIPNRGYLHYKVGKNETPKVNPGEKPKDKDVITPGDPTDPEYPENPTEIEPLDPTQPEDPTEDPKDPTIPTTPEVIVDPLNVDFRMGVVNQGTDLLDNAEYRIKSFTPTRGEGGIKDGKIYVGKVKFDIEDYIKTEDVGFVKLKDLPAGRYVMEETVAPVKGDVQYRLVTSELEFIVHEDEETVTIVSPIVKNGKEVTGDKTINVKELYRDDDGITRNNENWDNHEEVLDGEAMLHHYRYINTPATGTLAQVPFFLGGGVAVSAGLIISRRKKEENK